MWEVGSPLSPCTEARPLSPLPFPCLSSCSAGPFLVRLPSSHLSSSSSSLCFSPGEACHKGLLECGAQEQTPRWFSRGTDDHEIILGQEKCPSYCGLNHGDVRCGALQFILTQRLTRNHRFLSPCCLFNCLCRLEFALLVFLSPDCPCFCVCVHAPCACVYVCLTVCAPLSRAPPLSLPVSCPPSPPSTRRLLSAPGVSGGGGEWDCSV